MNVRQAAQSAISFLDVDEDRYPLATAVVHVNEAMHTLSREYDPGFQKVSNNISLAQPSDTSTAEWLRYPGAIPVGSIFIDTDWEFEYVTAAWKDPFKQSDRLEEWPYESLLDYYGDAESSVPERFAIFADRMIVRPIPSVGTTFSLRMLWAGKPVIYEELESPPWLRHAPWGVVYRTCEVASGWLLEDERINVFTTARQEQMDGLGITKSMGLETNNYRIREP